VIKIRLFEHQDAAQIAQLFHDTVRAVNSRDYSSEQVKAWAPDDLYFRNWAEVCADRFTYVADDAGIIAGFGELEPNGHIDCFYCHKNYQRCGVGSAIYQTIEAKAIELSLPRLFVEASITAQPFFQRLGFTLVTEQEVSCRGAIFINYRMEKFLENSPAPYPNQPINSSPMPRTDAQNR
jgi:putative acetyltransferase